MHAASVRTRPPRSRSKRPTLRVVRNVESDETWKPNVHASYRSGLTIEEQFRSFRRANPEVERWLVQRCRELKRQGINHYSMTGLWEELRWLTDLGSDHGFKLNNNFRAPMARRLMARHPDLKGFFRTRRPPTRLGSRA